MASGGNNGSNDDGGTGGGGSSSDNNRNQRHVPYPNWNSQPNQDDTTYDEEFMEALTDDSVLYDHNYYHKQEKNFKKSQKNESLTKTPWLEKTSDKRLIKIYL